MFFIKQLNFNLDYLNFNLDYLNFYFDYHLNLYLKFIIYIHINHLIIIYDH